MKNTVINTEKIKTFLPIFKGFYGSFWEDYLTAEGEAEHYNLPEDFDFLAYVNWNQYFNDLSRQFCNIAERELKEFVKCIEFEELISPKFYNFTNDSINCTIEPNTPAIQKYILENAEQYSKYLKENFTSCPGFISYYSNDFEVWKEITENFTNFKKSFYLGSILDFIAQNEGINQEVFYYEVEDVYISKYYTDKFYQIIKDNDKHNI